MRNDWDEKLKGVTQLLHSKWWSGNILTCTYVCCVRVYTHPCLCTGDAQLCTSSCVHFMYD